MQEHRSTPKAENKASKKIVTATLLSIAFLMIFYHHGTGRLEKTWHYKSGFYITLSDGRTFEASACEKGVNLAPGVHFQYTAIGPNITLGGRMIFRPVLIRCDTW